jgi:hypothetical protein
MNSLYVFIRTIFISIVTVYSISAQTFSLVPQKDNSIYSEGDSSNGKGYYLFTGATNNGAERRALIKFDLSAISQTDSILTASFQVHVSKTTSGAQMIKLFRLIRDWGEGESDAKFEEGGGAIAKPGDATWNYAFFNTTSWTQAGGDYENVPTDSLEISGIGTYTWSGAGIFVDVRNWIKNPGQNYGWIIIADDKTASSKRFNSGNNPDNPPLLNLQTIPTKNRRILIDDGFKISPNPSKGEFIVSHNKVAVKTIQIIDLTGKETKAVNIISKSPSGMRLSLTQKGMYIVIINNTYYRKLIVL